MSHALLNHLKYLYYNQTNKVIDIKHVKIGLGLFLIPHLIYTMSTREENTIILKDKYEITTNGFTKFIIIDRCNRHYLLNNSLWFWKWDSIEDWSKIKKLNEGCKIKIKCYGFRLPFLGVFPNIYDTDIKSY